jgi:hypothetical protein
MSLRRTLLIAALISMAPTALVVAQTDPQSDTTSPSSASSPHQRDATSTHAPEASSTDNTNSTSPSAASSPHQQHATKDSTHMASKQSMRDCIAKQQADNSGMSKSDAKKACKAQMRNNSG